MPKAPGHPKIHVEGHHQAAPKNHQKPSMPAQSANRSETGKVHPPYRQSRHSKPGIPALPDQIPTPQLIANPHRSKWRDQNSTSCDSVLERFSDAEKQPAQIKNQTWRPRNLHRCSRRPVHGLATSHVCFDGCRKADLQNTRSQSQAND